MTTINKLNRALESLKKVIAKPSEFNKQKEKVSLCITITDLVCKSNEKNALLTFTVSSLIQLLEDADSNTRLIIDESLNKIIRASMDNSNYVAKILIALLKVLGANTNEKCLKAALWRISELSHFVRPQKGKIYVKALVPIIAKIAARKDESIVETLAESLPNILKHIGLFSSDNDIKGLLKTFVKNLHSDMPEIRRAAAFSIIAVCKYSRQPEYFFPYVLTTVLDLLYECQKSEQESRNLVQGCLSCIRNILPYVSNDNSSINCEHHLQVYELCLSYAKFHDHNVVTAALETLNELLQNSSPALIRRLTTKGGLATSTLRKQENRGSTLSLDDESEIMSIGSTIARTEDGVFPETTSSKRSPLFSSSAGSCSDLNSEQRQIRTEKWIQEYPDRETETISSSLLNINTSHFANSDDEEDNKESGSNLVSSFRAMSVDNIQQLNDHDERRQKFQSEKSINMSFMSNATSMNTLSIDLDIGEVIDETDVPLNYCARFLVSAFLLDNQNSKKVRVSVLSLTLNCLSRVLKIYPQVANISLEKSSTVYESYNNLLQVILSYSPHEDQQVRGLVCIVIGNFIVSSLIEDNYLLKQSNYLNESLLVELTNHLLKGLQDKSSVCVKNTLYAVSSCIHLLMLCSKFKLSIPFIEAIFSLVDNPYWLIKVKILEIIGDMCFETLYHVNENSTSYQDRAFKKVIIVLLGDIDGRVRSAAASCLIRFAKSAYYPMDHKYESVCVTFAKKLNTHLTIPLMKNFDHEIEEPLERSLSRILHHLKGILEDAASKHIMAGCVEALSLLAYHYPPIDYSSSWQCCYLDGISLDSGYSPCQSFDTVVSLMTNSTLLLNFDMHPQLLKLSSQLFSALCASNLKTKKSSDTEIVDSKWSFLSDSKLKDLAESYVAHLLRICHVFDDVVTGVTLKSPLPLNTSPQIQWPLPVDELVSPKQEAFIMCTQTNTKTKSFFKLEEKSVPIMQYSRFPLYVKLSELLKSAFNNYKVTLKPESSEKFVNFLKTVIDCVAEALNYTTMAETDRITKELLAFLHDFMVFVPISCVKCVTQLLRSLFGINKVAESLQATEYEGARTMSISLCLEGFYDSCFQSAYDKIANFVSYHSDNSGSVELLKGWTSQVSPTKQFKRKITINMLPPYIKFFEPSVIQSLKQYTVSSNTELQAEVLNLLSELVQLKVNYCLLDSEQVFIKFVLSQFQLIEEGQLLSVENLLPKMFNFLIHLANEKHSKPVMSVPKVIQLCDSLIASGQAISHCVLAIEPLVQHVFLKHTVMANSTEIKELETQQDVLFAMLLRLLPHSRSLNLIASVLSDSEDEVKLKRSCLVVEIFFSTLMECKITVEDDESYENVVNLLFALHRSSFTEQHILNVLFNIYHAHKANDFGLWLPCVSAVLLYIVTTYKETTLLVAVEQMLNHPVFLDTEDDTDPLFINVAKNAPVIPEKAFIRFLCEIIYKAFQRINNAKILMETPNKNSFWKYKSLSEFMLVISYIIKSGKYEIIKTELSLSEYPNEDGKKFMFEIADLSSCLLVTYPIITLRLYELLMVLKRDDNSLSCYLSQSNFELDIFGTQISVFNDKLEDRNCLSLTTLKLGIFLLTCLRKNEILSNTEILKAFLEFNFKEYLISVQEPPVYELRSHLQSSSIASNVFLQIAQNTLPLIINENKLLKNVLQYLQGLHANTKGQVLLLCCHPQLLNNSDFFISNRAYELSIKIIAYLSWIQERQKFEEQLKEQDIHLLIEQVENSNFSQPLMTRIAEMASSWYQISFPVNENRPLTFDRLRLLVADKQWFFTQVKHKCCSNDDSLNFVIARLLAYLPLDEIVSIMRSQNFNNKIIPSCFTIGAELSVQDGQSPESCSDLFSASRLTLFRHVEHLSSLLPRTHQVYGPIKRESSKKETQYGQRMDILFSDKEFTETISCLAAALYRYLTCVEKYQFSIDSENSYKLMADFSVLSLELVHWMIRNHRKWSRSIVMSILKCSVTMMKMKQVSELLTSTQLGSIIYCIYALTETHQNEIIKESFNTILNELKNTEDWDTIHSSHLTSILIDYFINKLSHFGNENSVTIIGLIRQFLVILSQCASFYNYLRIPLEVWKHVTLEDVSVGSCITLNNLPENFLQDREILQNFVSRLTLLGWNNRLQFEECWMSLLIALNSLPEYESSEEEVLALSQINSMAVNAVTSLLVQTMYHPIPGNKISPQVFHLSRNKYFDDVHCKWRRKLSAANDILCTKIFQENEYFHILHKNTNVNMERLHNKNKYSFNQISMEYLTFNCTNSFTNEEDVPISFHFNSLRAQYSNRISVMKSLGIDTNSCIYFLIEFYNRWLAKPDNQSVDVLIEILNSMLTISDLFTELSQFSWLLESGVIMWKKYSKDNDIICAYLTVIICKSSSIATPSDNDSQKLIVKILNSGLNSNKKIVQHAALHGLLYLLESIFKKDVLEKNEIITGDYRDGILSSSILFVLENLDVELVEKFNDEMISCVISIAFYLMENQACGDNIDIIIDRLCKLSVRGCKLKKWKIHITIVQGFYNLILCESEFIKRNDLLMQFMKETFSLLEYSTSVAVLNLQLLLALMYFSGDFEDTRNSEISSDVLFDTEKLVSRMEKLSMFFERIKKGSKQEALIICAVLPKIIIDFFSTSEILNKVILEFLFPNHPHTELMAEVVFQVFQNAIQQSQLVLIQDWVLSLLNNFAKYPLPRAIYYLNCFFVSASTNPWLRALFPFIAKRYGCLEYEDRKIACISAKQFYSQLSDGTQKSILLCTFQAAEKVHPESLFSDIVKTIL